MPRISSAAADFRDSARDIQARGSQAAKVLIDIQEAWISNWALAFVPLIPTAVMSWSPAADAGARNVVVRLPSSPTVTTRRTRVSVPSPCQLSVTASPGWNPVKSAVTTSPGSPDCGSTNKPGRMSNGTVAVSCVPAPRTMMVYRPDGVSGASNESTPPPASSASIVPNRFSSRGSSQKSESFSPGSNPLHVTEMCSPAIAPSRSAAHCALASGVAAAGGDPTGEDGLVIGDPCAAGLGDAVAVADAVSVAIGLAADVGSTTGVSSSAVGSSGLGTVSGVAVAVGDPEIVTISPDSGVAPSMSHSWLTGSSATSPNVAAQ